MTTTSALHSFGKGSQGVRKLVLVWERSEDFAGLQIPDEQSSGFLWDVISSSLRARLGDEWSCKHLAVGPSCHSHPPEEGGGKTFSLVEGEAVTLCRNGWSKARMEERGVGGGWGLETGKLQPGGHHSSVTTSIKLL